MAEKNFADKVQRQYHNRRGVTEIGERLMDNTICHM